MNFVRNTKGRINKDKGKFQFKCFNCGTIIHYAKKCHFEKNKGFYKKKGLYSKEDSISSNESDGEEREAWEVLFITQETQNHEHEKIEINETVSEGEWNSDLIHR